MVPFSVLWLPEHYEDILLALTSADAALSHLDGIDCNFALFAFAICLLYKKIPNRKIPMFRLEVSLMYTFTIDFFFSIFILYISHLVASNFCDSAQKMHYKYIVFITRYYDYYDNYINETNLMIRYSERAHHRII